MRAVSEVSPEGSAEVRELREEMFLMLFCVGQDLAEMVSASGCCCWWVVLREVAWDCLVLSLWVVMVTVQGGLWCLQLLLPCWIEGHLERLGVGLGVEGELGGLGGLGEID